MTVSNKAWQKYVKTLAAIDQTAARKFEVYVRGLDLGKYANRKKAIDYAVKLASVYGESAAAAALSSSRRAMRVLPLRPMA